MSRSPVSSLRMAATAADNATQGPGFFASLPLLAAALDTFDSSQYRIAPDDWELAVTDIVDSTGAIAKGRHKTVNFVAAMGITALRNLCAPTRIPFLFGGDGAVVMVPPEYAAQARVELARVRGMAARDFEMTLRAGIVPVKELRRLGTDVLVGRYEPTPGNSFGVFLGGGVGLLEASIRGRGNDHLAALSAVPVDLDDRAPVDLEGLSCRWDTLHSARGAMLTLILQGATDLSDVYAKVVALAGPDSDARPVRQDTLRARWPPAGFMLEARARRRGGSLPVWAARVLIETLLARLVFARAKPIGNFDPQRYRSEMITNTDFCKLRRDGLPGDGLPDRRDRGDQELPRRSRASTRDPLWDARVADGPHDLSSDGAEGQSARSLRRWWRRRIHKRLPRSEERGQSCDERQHGSVTVRGRQVVSSRTTRPARNREPTAGQGGVCAGGLWPAQPIADMLADSDSALPKGGLFDHRRQLSALIGRTTTPMAETVAAAIRQSPLRCRAGAIADSDRLQVQTGESRSVGSHRHIDGEVVVRGTPGIEFHRLRVLPVPINLPGTCRSSARRTADVRGHPDPARVAPSPCLADAREDALAMRPSVGITFSVQRCGRFPLAHRFFTEASMSDLDKVISEAVANEDVPVRRGNGGQRRRRRLVGRRR